VLGLSFSGLTPSQVRLHLDGADPYVVDVPPADGRAALDVALSLGDLAAIEVTPSGADAAEGALTLECSYYGRRFALPRIPCRVPP
jgi:hypothetical protein